MKHDHCCTGQLVFGKKTALVVSKVIFQLIDLIGQNEQNKHFHGSILLHLCSYSRKGFVNKEFKILASQWRHLPGYLLINLKSMDWLNTWTNLREPKLSTNPFFSNFSGTPGISRQKSRDIPPKSLVFPGFRRTYRTFLVPTRSRGRPPPHLKISGPKSFGVGSFFLPGIERKMPNSFCPWSSPTPALRAPSSQSSPYNLFGRSHKSPTQQAANGLTVPLLPADTCRGEGQHSSIAFWEVDGCPAHTGVPNKC